MTPNYHCCPLLEKHRTSFFSCGHEHLDRWLQRRALADKNLGRSATHVWVDDEDIVIAYFTLLQTTIREADSILSRIRPPGFPRNHELPGILIGKLALDDDYRDREASSASMRSINSPTLWLTPSKAFCKPGTSVPAKMRHG